MSEFSKGNLSAARVLDGWYAACRSDELQGTPISRTIYDMPIVLFRDAGGRASALLDRCAHRNAPLSLGQVDDAGRIACPYHGWRFDGGGACREVPGLLDGGDHAGRSVPSFAACEQDDFVWIWARADAEPVGRPEASRPSTSLRIPDTRLPCPRFSDIGTVTGACTSSCLWGISPGG